MSETRIEKAFFERDEEELKAIINYMRLNMGMNHKKIVEFVCNTTTIPREEFEEVVNELN